MSQIGDFLVWQLTSDFISFAKISGKVQDQNSESKIENGFTLWAADTNCQHVIKSGERLAKKSYEKIMFKIFHVIYILQLKTVVEKVLKYHFDEIELLVFSKSPLVRKYFYNFYVN